MGTRIFVFRVHTRDTSVQRTDPNIYISGPQVGTRIFKIFESSSGNPNIKFSGPQVVARIFVFRVHTIRYTMYVGTPCNQIFLFRVLTGSLCLLCYIDNIRTDSQSLNFYHGQTLKKNSRLECRDLFSLQFVLSVCRL